MSAKARASVRVRNGELPDLAGINDIYNRFVTETAVTFDVTPFEMRDRLAWFEQFGESGPHRLLVAVDEAALLGFACSKEFRHKEAYATSVETTIYLAPDATGGGVGTRLYAALFAALDGEDVHRAYAGITLPNAASIALHEKLGFRPVGTFEEVGRKLGRYWSVRWYQKDL